MGLFGFLKGKGDKSRRYVSESAFRENLAMQTAMAPQTLAELRKHGVTAQTNLRLEFFFYTDKEVKGQALAKKLQALQYEVEYGPAAGDSHLVLVTGWSDSILMSEASVVEWTGNMCSLGCEHDCEFDGWGTNPSQ